MDFENVLATILNAVVVAAVTYGMKYLATYLKEKYTSEKVNRYIQTASDAISSAVLAVNQTFVDGLKAEGKFTKEKQQEAFEMAKGIVIDTLSDTVLDNLSTVLDDVEQWIAAKIEAAVAASKKK